MSFDTLLLSVFAKDIKFNPDIVSVQRRSKILFLIVANFAVLLVLTIYPIFMLLYLPQKANLWLLFICSAFVTVSFASTLR